MRPAIAALIAVLVLSGQACFGSLSDVVDSLDETVGKDVDMRLVTTPLAKLLEIEKKTFEKALFESKLKVSDIVLAKFIADKTEQKVEGFLTSPAPEWPKVLAKFQISTKDAEEHVDMMQPEVAMVLFDFRRTKRR